jgi:alpha/beta superfamily hydrolase
MVGLAVGVGDPRVVALLGLGLPVDLEDRYDFEYLRDAGKPVLVVQGENDEFGSGDHVAAVVGPLGSHITVVRIPDTDHFFAGKLDELRSAVRGYYESGPGAKVLVAV